MITRRAARAWKRRMETIELSATKILSEVMAAEADETDGEGLSDLVEGVREAVENALHGFEWHAKRR